MLRGSIQRINRPKPWRARYGGLDGREHSRSAGEAGYREGDCPEDAAQHLSGRPELDEGDALSGSRPRSGWRCRRSWCIPDASRDVEPWMQQRIEEAERGDRQMYGALNESGSTRPLEADPQPEGFVVNNAVVHN